MYPYTYTANQSQQFYGSAPNGTFTPQHGVWSFDSNNLSGAQFRWYTENYGTPEVLFQVYNNGARDEMVVNARLKWFPGPLETIKTSRTGTLLEHMAAIAEEMAILGLPPLHAQDIPAYPLSNGNERLIAFRQGNRFEGIIATPYQPTASRGPVDTGRRSNGLQTYAGNSLSIEPHRESPKQHTPSYGPPRETQERGIAATFVTQTTTTRVEPQSSTVNPPPHHVGFTNTPRAPVAISETPQTQHVSRPPQPSISPQQTFQSAPIPLVTAPNISHNEQHEDRIDSRPSSIENVHPKPAPHGSPSHARAIPQDHSPAIPHNSSLAIPQNGPPAPESQPQKPQGEIAAPEILDEPRENQNGSLAPTHLRPLGSLSKVRRWISTQQDVTPLPIPEDGQELRVPPAVGTGLPTGLETAPEPSNILGPNGSGAVTTPGPEVQSRTAHIASPQMNVSEPETESNNLMYTCDACKKPVMGRDRVKCDSCTSVQYCSNACKRGQQMYHMPQCIGRNQPQSSSLPGTIGEDKLLGDDDLSIEMPDFDDEFPCFTCQGINEHQPGCFITEFRHGPRPEYNRTMLSELVDHVHQFDPEQWREHQNPVKPEPEPETFAEALAKSNEIIKKEASYLNDPFLHVVPDRVLPLMWALRTLPNTKFQFMNEDGEIYAPEHPVWAEHEDEE